MTLSLLLALTITTAVPTGDTSSPEVGVRLATSMTGRKATLLGGVELAATYMPSLSSPLRITDDIRFGLTGASSPLDQGGGVDAGARQLVALLLGLLLGFGTGHLVAGDRNGFVLFLLVDIAIIVISSVAGALVGGPFVWLGGVALLISHVIQGLDAYGHAGGQRFIQLNREREVRVAAVGSGSGNDSPAATTRALAFAF